MAAANRLARGINNTAFSPNPDLVAQMTGSGAPLPSSVAPTYAATMDITAAIENSTFVLIAGVNATSATVTLTTKAIALAGAHLVIQVNAAGGTVTATFSTGFRVTGTLAPTIGTSMLIHFVSDGTTWNEVARTGAALA